MAISQIAALTAHISFLLWQLHIWQTRSWQIYPPHQWQFHRFLLYSESSYLADQVLADQPPIIWQFHRLLLRQLLFQSYSESSTFGRPGLGRSTPSSMAILLIPALLWKLIFGRPSVGRSNPPHQWQFHRFLWNSYFILTLTAQHLADQVLADLPPHQMAISQIPALLWKLIIGRPSVGRSTPCQMAILQIAALTAHISFLLWELTTLRAQHLADQFLSDVTPHIRWQFHRFLLWQLIFHSYFESSSFGRPGPDSSTPIQWWFHRFLWNSYFIPPLSAYHLADQVLADLPPFNNNCAHIWQTKWWQI